MRDYVDKLGGEYEKSYLRVARQQRIDEEYLKRRVGDLASRREDSQNSPGQQSDSTEDGGSAPVADLVGGLAYRQWEPDRSDPVYLPTLAWKMLQNPEEFARLVAFLDTCDYKKSDFVQGFADVKPMLEKRAGIKKRKKDYQLAILSTHADTPGRSHQNRDTTS
jgi:hypothetical protein